MLEQPRIGRHFGPGLPIAINGTYPAAVSAPAAGDHTADMLRDRSGLSEEEIQRLLTEGTVA
jgi:2-methylfumaryl-CoA isomerase